jgi:hypothetical protein
MGRGGVIPMSVWIGLEVSLRMERVVFLVPLWVPEGMLRQQRICPRCPSDIQPNLTYIWGVAYTNFRSQGTTVEDQGNPTRESFMAESRNWGTFMGTWTADVG